MCTKVASQCWQGLWEDVGRCLEQLSPLTVRECTLKQAHKSVELVHCLKEGVLPNLMRPNKFWQCFWAWPVPTEPQPTTIRGRMREGQSHQGGGNHSGHKPQVLKEMQDLWKNYSHKPGEAIAAWLLQCQDTGSPVRS